MPGQPNAADDCERAPYTNVTHSESSNPRHGALA